jgi:hypothetical protein
MIWELHKDGCEYLYDGHVCLGSVDPDIEKDNPDMPFTGWVQSTESRNYPLWKEFKTKLEAKAWVESKVKEVTAHEN